MLLLASFFIIKLQQNQALGRLNKTISLCITRAKCCKSNDISMVKCNKTQMAKYQSVNSFELIPFMNEKSIQMN